MNYYNEFDPFAAEWLKSLIKNGLIPDGEVDTRSIVDVQPDELREYNQCHFFAGIGGWIHALRLAEWPDDRPIWTGSCPCQPFSVAGKGKGKDDERHLWPIFHRLISECRPPVVMGEQVAGKAGYGWFDGVQSDLEREGYASRAVDIPACAVNAPHIRQRLYWIAVAQPECQGEGWRRLHKPDESTSPSEIRPSDKFGGRSSDNCDMGNTDSAGQREHGGAVAVQTQQPGAQCSGGDAYDMADANQQRCDRFDALLRPNARERGAQALHEAAGSSHWNGAEWLTGADGKTRRAKPGVRLLVDGVPNRVGRLRGYGNAIVPPLAAEVIKAFMEVADG